MEDAPTEWEAKKTISESDSERNRRNKDTRQELVQGQGQGLLCVVIDQSRVLNVASPAVGGQWEGDE